MRIFLVTMLVLLAMGCSDSRQTSVAPIPSVPAIGDSVRATNARAVPNTIIMTASSQTRHQYNLTISGVDFVLGVNDDGIVRYISTDRVKVKTPEGICVGDSYKSVTQRVGVQAVAEPGWAYHVELPSGWRAAFVQGDSMTEGKLAPDARVRWLFKR